MVITCNKKMPRNIPKVCFIFILIAIKAVQSASSEAMTFDEAKAKCGGEKIGSSSYSFFPSKTTRSDHSDSQGVDEHLVKYVGELLEIGETIWIAGKVVPTVFVSLVRKVDIICTNLTFKSPDNGREENNIDECFNQCVTELTVPVRYVGLSDAMCFCIPFDSCIIDKQQQDREKEVYVFKVEYKMVCLPDYFMDIQNNTDQTDDGLTLNCEKILNTSNCFNISDDIGRHVTNTIVALDQLCDSDNKQNMSENFAINSTTRDNNWKRFFRPFEHPSDFNSTICLALKNDKAEFTLRALNCSEKVRYVCLDGNNGVLIVLIVSCIVLVPTLLTLLVIVVLKRIMKSAKKKLSTNKHTLYRSRNLMNTTPSTSTNQSGDGSSFNYIFEPNNAKEPVYSGNQVIGNHSDKRVIDTTQPDGKRDVASDRNGTGTKMNVASISGQTGLEIGKGIASTSGQKGLGTERGVASTSRQNSIGTNRDNASSLGQRGSDDAAMTDVYDFEPGYSRLTDKPGGTFGNLDQQARGQNKMEDDNEVNSDGKAGAGNPDAEPAQGNHPDSSSDKGDTYNQPMRRAIRYVAGDGFNTYDHLQFGAECSYDTLGSVKKGGRSKANRQENKNSTYDHLKNV